jgi:large subunit ribosomal protein L4e
MKAKVFGIDGSEKSSLELPKVFETEYKPKLIKRAVLALQTAQKQAKGADPRAGLKNTARYQGSRHKPGPWKTINTGKARLPRTIDKRYLLYGRVLKVAQAVGGRSPNAPQAWKRHIEKINKKEKALALESAIAATMNEDLVKKRFIFDTKLPIIIDDGFEGIEKTKKIIEILSKIGLEKDLENAKNKVRRRAGKGKARGRKKKIKKSVLIVTRKNDKVLKASRNITGVDAVTVTSLNVELLAPGAEAGRLVVWTKGAIEKLEGKKETKEKTEKKIKSKKEKLKESKKTKKVSKKTQRKKGRKTKTKKEADEE